MSNHINDIEITNFKSIRHQKIDGCRRINLFIGYPNVGKSNILEAMSLLSYMSATPKISDIIRMDSFSELFFDGSTSDEISVEILDRLKTVLTFKNTAIHIEGLQKNEAEHINDWQTVIEGDWNKSGKVGIHKEINTESDSKKNDNIVIKKYQFRNDVFNSGVQDSSLKAPFGKNLYYTLETNKKLRAEASELLGIYKLRLAFEKGDKYSLKFLKMLPDDTIFLLPFHQIADTLQRLLFYKAAIATNENNVLLFEEPEAHMFPPYIRKFTADVMFDKTNQFFIATHSPYVLNEFLENIPEEVSIYTVDYKNGETEIARLSDNDIHEIIQYGVDLFFNLESYLNNGQINNA